jgi:glycosyltransferase involved in cell wall biosynthesis
MKVKYCGPAKDYSGYGEANRHDIAALVAAGCELTTQLPNYTFELSEFGILGELAKSFENRPLGYKVKILHTTPNVWPQFIEPNIYHIGRLFWETDKIPLDFALGAQSVQEIWTGSEYNAKAIRNAGVTKPIYIIPEAIDINIDPLLKPYIIENEKDYKFYSIFEWTERKNPKLLLEAFWREFEKDENVSLTLKTYLDNFTPDKRYELNNQIKMVKKRLNLTRYAPVYLFRNLMDRRQVYRFHKSFNCFISTHRGEGWGIPQMEALLMNHPIISTNCGGIHEYLKTMEHAILLNYKLVPLMENNRNKQWYTPDQKWAEVDINDVRAAMRWVYNNQEKANTMGRAGKKLIENTFSLSTVGQKMVSRLRDIQKSLEPKL